MEVSGGEEQERSRVEELAEEVMTKEQLARKKELEDIERAGYNFEGTRLELVADEVFDILINNNDNKNCCSSFHHS